MFATVYVLFYGRYPELHKRNIDSLRKHLPKDDSRLVCWANTVCNETISELCALTKEFPNALLVDSDENVPKYKAMQQLYYEQAPPESDWILWLDDDTYITESDWWKKTKGFIQSDPSTCYVGQRWYVHHLKGQWEFIAKSKWFRGKHPEMLPTKKQGVKKPGIWFMTGGYVWLKTSLMQLLNWPDPRLSHNGGDTLLGEAVRQQGLPRHHFDYGVAVNKAKRRGLHEKPAGSTQNVRR